VATWAGCGGVDAYQAWPLYERRVKGPLWNTLLTNRRKSVLISLNGPIDVLALRSIRALSYWFMVSHQSEFLYHEYGKWKENKNWTISMTKSYEIDVRNSLKTILCTWIECSITFKLQSFPKCGVIRAPRNILLNNSVSFLKFPILEFSRQPLYMLQEFINNRLNSRLYLLMMAEIYIESVNSVFS
jgi:hypothetical protein